MHYDDSAQQLSDRLSIYKAHKASPSSQGLSDERWGAAYFYAALLQRSDFREDVLINRTRLDELAQWYRQEHQAQVNVDNLLKKDWLRIVFGNIQIPYLTGRAVDLYEQAIVFREEFVFFDNLQPELIKTRDDLILLAGGPDSPVALTLEKTKNLFWYDRNERIELARLDAIRNILNDAAAFGFLSALENKMKDNNLRILCEDCHQIHQTHKAFFTHTPPLNELIDNGILQTDDDGVSYQVHLRGQSGIERDALHEHYSAILWQDILNQDHFTDDQERLRFWYYRTVYHQGFVEIKGCFTAFMLQRFLDVAEQVVLQDSDLASGEREYFRLLSDNSNTHHDLSFLWEYPAPPINLKSETISLYETQTALGLLFHGEGVDVLVRQRCRRILAYLVVQLVKCDHIRSFNRLQALFDQSGEKPYLLWETSLMITHWRPEYLPFMVIRGQTASLAFVLLLKAELSNYTGRQAKMIRRSLIQDQGHLLLKYLAADHEIDKQTKTRIIFECLLYTTFRKFDMARPEKEDNLQISEDFRKTVNQTPMPGTHYNGGKKITPLFIAEIGEELLGCIENYAPVDRYQNGLTGLPLLQLDLACWIMEVTMNINAPSRLHAEEAHMERAVRFFSTVYLSAINTTSIERRDYFGDKKVKPALPSWSEHRSNNRLINWGMAILQLQEHDLLDDFLKPDSLVFNTNDDIYDEFNRFTAQKLRTHLFVLIDAFNGLFDDRRQLELKGLPVNDVLVKLEMRIKDIVVRYGATEPAKCRFDIFGESLERRFSHEDGKEMLPIIAALINRFLASNREAIIQALTQSDQLVRSLKMLDRIVSEKERLRLLKMITERSDFKDILADLSFQDMQFVTSTLSQQDNFIAEAEEALNYTEKVSARHTYRKNENEVFIFRMRLLNAYHKRDLAAIDATTGPTSSYVQGQLFNTNEEKDFYRALILMKNGRGEEGYELFDQLASRADSDRPVIALNRFAAKLQWATEIPDLTTRKQLAAEALEQWQQFDNTHSDKKKWPDIEDSILFNLLHVNEILEDYDNFDYVYSGINIETRMRPEFLEICVSVLLERKMQHAAEQLLTEAKLFHRLADGSYPEFITALENRMNTPETITYLSGQYDRIYRLAAEDLVKVIPATENGGVDLPEFLLNELTGAATDMLNMINTLPFVDHEDKYSDLIMLSLNGRIRSYKWHAENLRSGFSDPEKPALSTRQSNLGLVDFAIVNGLQRLATCEALILEGKDTIDTQKHNLKIFNYDPARRLFYILIYFKGGSNKFNNAWRNYQGVIEDFIEFPNGYELSGKVQPVSSQPDHDGIRIGISSHGTDTQIYHLFINVDYRLELRKKMVSEDKQSKNKA